MIYNLVKYLLGGVFLLSAFVKSVDFSSTAELFSTLLGTGIVFSKILLSTLILIEILVAHLVITDQLIKNFAFGFIMTLTLIFLISNILFVINGEANCGCFGTQLTSSPVISIIKNILLLAGFTYLKFFNEPVKTISSPGL